MNLNITEQKEQPLLSRKEIVAELSFEKATPSKEEIKKQLVASLKAKENLVIVKNILTKFGSKQGTVTAYLYDSEEEMKKIEPKPKKKKKKEPKPEKPAEIKQPGQEKPKEKPEEKKTEEKKEEKPTEGKEEPKKEEKPAGEK